jgi:hypothetical protein
MDETLRPDGTGGLDLAQLERQMRGQRAQERRRVEDLPRRGGPDPRDVSGEGTDDRLDGEG